MRSAAVAALAVAAAVGAGAAVPAAVLGPAFGSAGLAVRLGRLGVRLGVGSLGLRVVRLGSVVRAVVAGDRAHALAVVRPGIFRLLPLGAVVGGGGDIGAVVVRGCRALTVGRVGVGSGPGLRARRLRRVALGRVALGRIALGRVGLGRIALRRVGGVAGRGVR